MSKRAGKYGLRKDYKGFTRGVGGLKCRCCGGDPYSDVRKCKNKQAKDEEAREAGEGCSCEEGTECSCGAGEEHSDDIPPEGEGGGF